MKKLGIPTTLGELRKMTEEFPEDTLLQFRNEPRHELSFEDEQGLVFQEEDNPDIRNSLMRILAKNAYKNGNMQVDDDVSKLCKTIDYIECQMGMISRFVDEQYKEQEKESIIKVMKQANKILNG